MINWYTSVNDKKKPEEQRQKTIPFVDRGILYTYIHITLPVSIVVESWPGYAELS